MRLTVDNLAVRRGEELIFAGLNLEVRAGEAMIVRGPNGAGKSTLLRAIGGLLSAEDGRIELLEREAEFADIPVAELAHYLGGDNAMKPALSVEENLQFWRDFGAHPHLEIDEALDMVGLDGLQLVPFNHLSTGQRRRIGIARLLVSYRPIWLLDEPTSGLDAASEKQFSELMQVHLEDGGLILAATHVPLGLDNAKELILQPLELGDVAS